MSPRLRGLCASVFVAATSCRASAPAAQPTPTSLAAGDATLTIDTAATTLTWARGGTTLAVFGAADLRVGSIDGGSVVSSTFNVDPTQVFVDPTMASLPDGLAWHGVRSFAVASASPAEVDLALAMDDGSLATLTLTVEREGAIKAVFRPDPSLVVALLRLRAHGSATEGFYGLGEYFDSVEHHGKVRAMQLAIDTSGESGDNEAHVPVPLVIGSSGWGLFVESRRPGAFGLGLDAPEIVDAVFATTSDSARGLTFHLYSAADPLDVTGLYYRSTSPPKLPAPWALGPWIWRNDVAGQTGVAADAKAIRDLDLATSGYWIDRPYATAIETFDFEPTAYPDPKSMLDGLHALGFATAIWHAPYVDSKDPKAASELAIAQSAAYFPPVSGLPLNPWSAPLDLTNGAAVAWWQSELQHYRDLGVDGYKLDYGEDVVPGAATIRTPWSFANGEDEQTMHSGYTLAYHSTYAQTVDPTGSFMLCRHGVWGDQANGCVVWPGDLDSSFAAHGAPATDETGAAYVSVGGLPASLVAGISLGPSGFPFYAADTGGYRHGPPDKELFVRWFESTALSSAMEVGTGSNTVAWETAGNPGFDAETLTLYRLYARLHLRLFPYAWTYARRLAVDGHPIVRPVGLAHPELGAHPSDAFLFGEDLYVAPVVARGQTTRSMTLPAGDWFDWWTGERRAGEVTVPAPLETLPLLLRAGGMVPMLRDTIDTLAATTDPTNVDSFVGAPGILTVRVAAGPAHTFTIYDGTTLFQARNDATTTLRIGQGTVFDQGAIFEVLGVGDVVSVSIDGGVGAPVDDVSALAASSGWLVTSDGVLHVRVLGGVHAIEVTSGQ